MPGPRSTAAGSVGSAVGQIAMLAGCRTVGLTGIPAKVRMCLTEFGYDVALGYKAVDFEEALRAACPNGVDIYFCNIAGSVSDSVYRQLALGARIPVYSGLPDNIRATLSYPHVEPTILNKRARMQGFLVPDYAHRYEEAISRLAAWVRAGKLHYREDIVDGIEHAPGAIAELYRGENSGKRLIRL